MPYNTKQKAVDDLLPGYRIVGEAPNMVKVSNPNAGRAGEPAQIDQQQGIVLSVQGPGGEPDTIIIKEVGNNPNAKGGIGYDVVQGPQKTPTRTASAASALEKLDAAGNLIPPGSPTKAVYLRDPKAPPGTQPMKLDDTVTTDPSTWTPIYDPNDKARVIALFDPANNKVGAAVPAPAAAKASGTFDNVIDPNDPAGKRVIAIVDKGDKSIHPVSVDPTTQKRTVQTPTAVYSVDDNNNVTKLIDIDKSVPLQAVVIDGTVYSFDPNEKDPNKRLTKISGENPLPQTIKQGDVTYVLQKNDDGTFTYKLPPGIEKPATLQTNTTARTLDWYDDKGNLIKSVENQNYVAPKVDQPTLQPTNTVAPMIMVADPEHPGQTKWIKNESRVTASQALVNLASQLSGHVVDNTISVDEAKSIIDGANAAMTAQTNVAKTTLDAANQAAQTGAGLLNQRVSSATGALNQFVSEIGSNQNIMRPIPGLGANLVGGLSEWVTGLGGGQPVYDAAAAMVKNASPEISGNPTLAGQAYQVLRGLMDLKAQKDGTLGQGEKPPAGVTPPGGATSGTSGFTAPVPLQTNVNVSQNLKAQQHAAAVAAGTAGAASTATLNAQGLMDNPQGRAMAGGQVPVATVSPVTNQPITAAPMPGQYNPAWQQGIRSAVGMPAPPGTVVGTIPTVPIPTAPVPWYPGAQFVAPPMAA